MKRKIMFILSGLILLSVVGYNFSKSQATAGESAKVPVTTFPATYTPQVITEIPTNTALPPTEQPTPTSTQPAELSQPLSENSYSLRSMIALRAASQAVDKMPGKYSWEEFRSCSTFVSQYLRQLSFPANGIQGQYLSYPDPFPWTNVVDQVNWLRRNYPSYTHDASLTDFLDGKLWSYLNPGDVIYLQTAENHNGYNTYYHTVVLVEYRNGEPIFAEFAAGMNNASTDRSFGEMTKNYQDSGGKWKVTPSQSSSQPLIVTWFDPLAVLHDGNLWRKPGTVVPNSNFAKENFNQVITINLYDGTASIFRNIGSGWELLTINGRQNFFAVTGRLLPANGKIAFAYTKENRTGLYDGDFGVYITGDGVYQHTWTPQLIASVKGFEYLEGFGDLPGPTFTSLMVPQVYDKKGRIEDYWSNSPFTFHRIPDVDSQDMLLRQDLLIKANNISGPNFGPIPVPQVYLSSGCINFDRDTWQIIYDYLQSQLDAGQRVGVIFSYPNFDQNLLPNVDIYKSPFFGGQFNKWCPTDTDACDPYDRGNYRITYLNHKRYE